MLYGRCVVWRMILRGSCSYVYLRAWMIYWLMCVLAGWSTCTHNMACTRSICKATHAYHMCTHIHVTHHVCTHTRKHISGQDNAIQRKHRHTHASNTPLAHSTRQSFDTSINKATRQPIHSLNPSTNTMHPPTQTLQKSPHT